MANRVLVLEISQLRGGEENYSLLVFYTVNPPITITVDGVEYVIKPTPSDQLPPVCDEYPGMVPQAYRNQLNSGASVFEQVTVKRRKNQTEQQLLQLVESKYPARAAAVVAEWRRLYARMGFWAVNV